MRNIMELDARQDEIGTPFCVTVDHQSALPNDDKYDDKVTICERASMEQIRVPISEVKKILMEK